MIKPFFSTLLLSSGLIALGSSAYAQTTPNTTQTDQSEEDWRKSKKKSDSKDPWDTFKNSNSWGTGTQRTMSPVEMLPEESRRFLMKERAQRLAEAGIGEPVDASFKPSPEGTSDVDLQADEKAAWAEMMKDMNGAPAAPSGQGQPGSPTQPQAVGEIGGQGTSSPSVMRGGSSASVADILSKIKGTGRAPQGLPQTMPQTISQGRPQGMPTAPKMPQGQTQMGQAQMGQAPTGQSPDGQAQSPSGSQSQADGSSQTESMAQAKAQADATAQAAAQAQADGQAQADSQSQATGDAQAAADASGGAAPEAISPLDRIQKNRKDRAASGSRSSASDYLKKGN